MIRIAPRALLPGLLAGGLALVPTGADAHGIQTNLERFSSLSAQLESSFSSGQPASHAEVRLLPPGGTPIALGHTDARGRLSFHLPAQASADWEIQVDAGPGHRDYLEVPPAGQDGRRGRAPLDAALRHPLGLGVVGLAGVLGGLLMRRPRV